MPVQEEPTAEELVQKRKAIFMISGEIVDEHLGIINELLNLHYDEEFNDHVTLLINSPGGKCSVSWSIIDIMDFVRFPVNTVALGEVCSAAADIFVNGDKRVMSKNSTLMVHSHSSLIAGTGNNLIHAIKGDLLEMERRRAHYIRNSNLSEKEIDEKLLTGKDNFFSPDEVLDMGLTDEIARVSNKEKRKKESRFTQRKVKNSSKPKAKGK